MDFQITAYLPSGFPVTVSLATDNPENIFMIASEFASKLQAMGFLSAPPALGEGEGSDLIVTVMRREKSDGTPIIDFYTEWGHGTDEPWGTYKYLHEYLNDKDEINAFLAASGFKRLEDIPLYDAQSPLKRTVGKRHAKETRVPTPFKLVRKQGKEKIGSDGQPYKPWELVRYEAATQITPSTSQSGSNSQNSTQHSDVWDIDAVNRVLAAYKGKLDADQLKVALGIKGRWSEWAQGEKAAITAVEKFLQSATVPF